MIAGRVLTPDGQPAANADVFTEWLFRDRPGHFDEVLAETTTGEDGRFTLTIEGNGEPWPRWAVGATKDGFGLGWTMVELSESEEIVIRLHQATIVAGRVVNPDGQPIEGAEVVVAETSGKEERDSIYLWSRFAETTGADGHFEFSGMPLGKFVRLSARASGYVLYSGSAQPVELMADLEIELERGGVITGRVVADGKPVPEVEVWARREHPYYERSMARTGADGRFELDQLKAGMQTVYVEAPKGWTAEVVRHVTANVGQPIELEDIKLIRGGVVTGVVRDRVTGQPIKSVSVKAYLSEEEFPFGGWWSAYPDAEGRYSLRLPPGRYWLHGDGRGEGYQYRGEEPWLHEVDIATGENVEGFDIPLTPEARVSGLVMDDGGRPVENVIVKAAGGADGETRTDARGRFTLGGRGDGLVSLLAIDDERGLVGQLVLPGVSEDARITLRPGAWAMLRIVDADGKGVQGQRVSCNYNIWDAERTYGRTLYVPAQFTDKEGRLRLGPLPAGVELDLWCFGAQEFITEREWPETFVLQWGEQRDLGTAVVDRGGQTIVGRILNIEHRPVPNCLVVDLWSGAEAQTSDDGKFELAGVPLVRSGVRPQRAYEALLLAGKARDALFAAQPVSEPEWRFPVELVLEPLGSAAGRVLTADGQPLADARVEAITNAWQRMPEVDVPARFGDARLWDETRTDDDGRFQFDSLIAGLTYQVAVRESSSDRSAVTRKVIADPGKTTDLGDLTLEGGD
ncbi:MAG: carboxypeptidase regulatory-like domain-containing protein [Armatimonadetes bacterium]|nr:carboxypeptidase regulatory-like domain-containing protein [Armatimonadota bacterium]